MLDHRRSSRSATASRSASAAWTARADARSASSRRLRSPPAAACRPPARRPRCPESCPAVAAAGRLRAAERRPRRVPRRAAARDPALPPLRRHRLRRRRRRRPRSSTTSCAAPSGSVRSTAATSCSSRSATRAPTCTRSSARRIAHEDDARARGRGRARSARAGGVTAAPDLQIGIAQGRLRSGTYGHEMRRTFVLPRRRRESRGAADVAARRRAGATSPRRPRRRRRRRFTWERLPGPAREGQGRAGRRVRADRLRAGAPRGARRATSCRCSAVRTSSRCSRPAARAPLGRAGSVVGITAEAGMGKSRLVAEVVRAVRAARRRRRVRRVPVLRHERRATSSGARSGAAARARRAAEPTRAELARRGRARDDRPALVQRAPLLGRRARDRDSRTTTSRSPFDAKLRKESLEGPARGVPAGAGARGAAGARARGLPLDRPALARPARRARARGRAPAGAVRARRPAGGRAGGGLGVERLPHFASSSWRARAGRGRAADPLASWRSSSAPEREASPALVELVAGAPQGNPFYIEELLNYIRGAGRRPAGRARAGELELPDSLHSLILSRIDTLPRRPRRTLKVASVIGRVVPRADAARRLPGARVDRDVGANLGTLRALDLDRARPGRRAGVPVQARRDPGGRVREPPVRDRACSTSASAATSRRPRPTDRAVSSTCSPTTTGSATTQTKKREYLVRAGEAAAGEYANAAAIDYFERLAPLVARAGARDAAAQARQGRSSSTGDWRRPRRPTREALARPASSTTRARSAWCETGLGEVARKHGRFDEAAELARRGGRRLRGRRRRRRRRTGPAPDGHARRSAGRLPTQAARATRRASRSASGSATRRHGRPVHEPRRSSPSTAATTSARASSTSGRSRSGAELGDRWASASRANLGMIAVLQGELERGPGALRGARCG